NGRILGKCEQPSLVQRPSTDVHGLIAAVEQLDPLKVLQIVWRVIENLVDHHAGTSGSETQRAHQHDNPHQPHEAHKKASQSLNIWRKAQNDVELGAQ